MSVDRECSENRRRHREAVTCSVVTEDFFFFIVRKSAPEQLLPSCENRSNQKNISLRNQRTQKNSRCHRMPRRFLSIVFFLFVHSVY